LGSDVQLVKAHEIYDRWGERVYEARNFSPLDSPAGWDGTFRGKKMPSGVYTYYFLIQFKDGEEETFVGSLTLLR
jgi:gliding motility-associated-like protein